MIDSNLKRKSLLIKRQWTKVSRDLHQLFFVSSNEVFDDFDYCPKRNQAIIDLWLKQSITSTSLIVKWIFI